MGVSLIYSYLIYLNKRHIFVTKRAKYCLYPLKKYLSILLLLQIFRKCKIISEILSNRQYQIQMLSNSFIVQSMWNFI